jgi:hypothetical protein
MCNKYTYFALSAGGCGGTRSLTSSLSSLLSVHGLATDVALHYSTVERRLDALRRAFVAFPVRREQGLAPKERAQSKWYFTDPRLARLASDFGAGQAPDPTALSEQQLAVTGARARVAWGRDAA